MKTHPLLLNDRDIELIRDAIDFELEMLSDDIWEDFKDAEAKGYRKAMLEMLLEKLPEITKEKNGLEK